MPISPTGRQVSAVYQFQSVFDVFPSAGNWQTLSAYDLSAGETRGFEADPLLGRNAQNGRDPFEPAPALPQGGGSLRVPLCLREHGWWLKNALGAPATSGAGPNYTHVFKSGKDTIPSLAQSRKIKAADYRRVRGLKVNGYRLRAEKAGGYPIVDLDTMLRDETNSAVDPTGTIVAAPALLRPPAARPVVRWESVALGVAMAMDISYSNNLTRFDPLGGNEYPAELDPGDTVVGGTLTTRYQDSTWQVLADAGTSGLLELEFAIPSDPTNKSIVFAFPKAKLAKKPMGISGPGVIDVAFDFSSEQQAAEAAMVVTLKNDVATY
jgi:hypothetical protein